MARRLPDESQQALDLEIRRFDEANVARLGLISIQERIPFDFTSWTVELEREGRIARLTCDAIKTLTLLFGNRLPLRVLDNLHQAMIEEKLEPRRVQEVALRANLEGKLTELANEWMDKFAEG